MVDPVAQRAACHSQEAFALLRAARSMREAVQHFNLAAYFGIERATMLADEASSIADKADRMRRGVMKTSEGGHGTK